MQPWFLPVCVLASALPAMGQREIRKLILEFPYDSSTLSTLRIASIAAYDAAGTNILLNFVPVGAAANGQGTIDPGGSNCAKLVLSTPDGTTSPSVNPPNRLYRWFDSDLRWKSPWIDLNNGNLQGQRTRITMNFAECNGGTIARPVRFRLYQPDMADDHSHDNYNVFVVWDNNGADGSEELFGSHQGGHLPAGFNDQFQTGYSEITEMAALRSSVTALRSSVTALQSIVTSLVSKNAALTTALGSVLQSGVASVNWDPADPLAPTGLQPPPQFRAIGSDVTISGGRLDAALAPGQHLRVNQVLIPNKLEVQAMVLAAVRASLAELASAMQ